MAVGASAAATDVRRSRTKALRAALDAIYLAQLKTITLVVAGYYLITIFAHMFVLPPEIKVPVTFAAVVAFLSWVVLHLFVRFQRIPARHSHNAILLPGVASVFLVYLHIWLSGDVHQMTNAVLSLLVFGFITLLPRIYATLTILCLGLYVYTLVTVGGEYTGHYAFMALAGQMISILCFVQRYRTLSNVERLLISNKSKSQALSRRAREAQRLLSEAEAAAEEARVANEAKGAFLANATHELRTPLTGVLGMMRLLSSTDMTEEQEELVQSARFSASTLLTLINDILDLSKLEEGKLALQPEPFVPGDLARRITDLMRPEAEKKGLVLGFHDCCDTTPELMGDSVRIGQVLFNLIGNAIKFTDEGRVDVTVSLSCNNENVQQLGFVVEDTGVGFDQSFAQRLFGRFEQADGSAIKRQAGTGLGLAICHELSVLMNGRLEAQSEPGVGSRFSFNLALPLAVETVAEEEAGQERVLHTSDASDRKLSILVAEDNKVNQMLIDKLLARDNWSISLVDDGEKAVDAILGQDFDIVLMDVRMPVVDGVDATRRVREADGARSRTPIIALTANTTAEDVEQYRQVGMDGVVGKPIQPEELERVIGVVLDVGPGTGFPSGITLDPRRGG